MNMPYEEPITSLLNDIEEAQNFLNEAFQEAMPIFPDFVYEYIKVLPAESLPEAEETLMNLYPVRYNIFKQLLEQQSISESLLERLTILNSFYDFVKDHTEKYTRESDEDIRNVLQGGVYFSTWRFFEECDDETKSLGLIDAATGSGKTHLMLLMGIMSGMKTVIVVPTNIIANKTFQKAIELANLYGKNIRVGLINKYSKDKSDDCDIIITTYDSFALDVEKDNDNKLINIETILLLCLDEAHRSLTRKRKNARDLFINAYKILFTGTSYKIRGEVQYEDRAEETAREIIQDEEQNKKIKHIHTITIQEGVFEGILCDVTAMVAYIDYDISEFGRNGEYTDAELHKIYSDNKKSIYQAIERVLKEIFIVDGVPQPVVIFVNFIEEAEELAEFLNQNGFNTRTYHSQQEDGIRDLNEQDFKNGKFHVLIAIDSLAEGWDFPKLKGVINGTITTSPQKAAQRGGRATRLDEDDPDKEGIIVDILWRFMNARNNQVLYADILGDVQLRSPRRKNNRNNKTSSVPNMSVSQTEHDLDIPQGEIVIYTSVEELRSLQRDRIREKERQQEKLATFESLNTLSFRLGVGTKYFSDYSGKELVDELYIELDLNNPINFRKHVIRVRNTLAYSPQFISLLEVRTRKLLNKKETFILLTELTQRFDPPLTPLYYSTTSTDGIMLFNKVWAELIGDDPEKEKMHTVSVARANGIAYSSIFIETLQKETEKYLEKKRTFLTMEQLTPIVGVSHFFFKEGNQGEFMFKKIYKSFCSTEQGKEEHTVKRLRSIGYSPAFVEALKQEKIRTSQFKPKTEIAKSFGKTGTFFSEGGKAIYERVYLQICSNEDGVWEHLVPSAKGYRYSSDFEKALEMEIERQSQFSILADIAFELGRGKFYFQGDGGTLAFNTVFNELCSNDEGKLIHISKQGKGFSYSPEFKARLMEEVERIDTFMTLGNFAKKIGLPNLMYFVSEEGKKALEIVMERLCPTDEERAKHIIKIKGGTLYSKEFQDALEKEVERVSRFLSIVEIEAELGLYRGYFNSTLEHRYIFDEVFEELCGTQEMLKQHTFPFMAGFKYSPDFIETLRKRLSIVEQ